MNPRSIQATRVLVWMARAVAKENTSIRPWGRVKA